MKKITTFFLFWTIFLSSFSQSTLSITGNILDITTYDPIPYHAVIIQSDSSNGGNVFPYYKMVYSDNNGVYGDTIVIPAGVTQWPFILKTYDCMNNLHTFDTTFVIGTTQINKDFYLCVNQDTNRPVVITGQANGITQTSAVLNGFVNPNGSLTFVTFEIGTTTNYGDIYSCGSFNGDSLFPVTRTIPNLTPGTLYHYRISGNNYYGTSNGVDSTFTTPDSTGCNAAFTYYQYANMIFHFVDLSTGNPSSWYWTFGDGGTSTYQEPDHQYAAGGWYNVTLTISDSATSCNDVYSEMVYAIDSSLCQAAYYAVPDSNTLYTYSFINQSTGNITSWYWDFGDGGSSTVQNPFHSYAQPGYYTVCLTIHGADSLCYDVQCDSIIVSGPGNCQAQYTYYPDSVSGIDNIYHFVDLSLGTPTSWTWNFGDPASGANNFSTVQNPTHTFSYGDTTYYVCLTIQCQGVQSVWCQQVVVEDPSDCLNYFTYQQFNNLQVAFNGFMVNQQPAVYSWNFGDGQTSTGQSVNHTYASQGMYYVSLTTVTDDSINCSYASSQIVQVGDSAQFNQVYGQIFAGNFPMETGLALIFSLDTINYSPFIDISTVDSFGIYYFTMVPQGDYLIYAIPFTPSGYLPTYYGDEIGWENATVVSLGQPNNPYNIHLAHASSYVPGIGNIYGMINSGNTKSIIVDKITMILMNEQGQAISFSQVEKDGQFEFPELDYGTYFLHAEMAGCSSDNIKVVITSDNPNVEVTLTFTGNKILGVDESEPMLESCLLYPNPVKNTVNITLTMKEMSNITVELYDLMGKITGHYNYHLNTGDNRISIPMTSLQGGIYTLRITTDSEVLITRKIIKTQ